jgi:hypothetical protein
MDGPKKGWDPMLALLVFAMLQGLIFIAEWFWFGSFYLRL